MSDRPLTAAIAVELRRAWEWLDGAEDLQNLGDMAIYAAFVSHGAPAELLNIIKSYGDTLPDESVLKYLREWNARQGDR
jgi:hypothetical protein